MAEDVIEFPGQSDPGLAPPQYFFDAETNAENAAISATIADINAAARKSGVELALEVSALVLKRFFNDDYAAFTTVDRSKEHSYRKLAAHPDLEMSPSTLQRLVRIGHQAATMPTGLAESLSPRHHRALLTVASENERESLAAQALQQGWSSTVLEAKVRATRPPSNAGRKPLAPAVRRTRAIGRALAQAKADGLRAKDLAKLPQAAFDEVEAALLDGERALVALRAAVAEARAKRAAAG